MRDFEELKERDKDAKKKEAADKLKAEEMRRAAMEGMASMFDCCTALMYCNCFFFSRAEAAAAE